MSLYLTFFLHVASPLDPLVPFQSPIVEQVPTVDRVTAVEWVPTFEQVPIVEPIPAFEQVLAIEQAPVVEHVPVVPELIPITNSSIPSAKPSINSPIPPANIDAVSIPQKPPLRRSQRSSKAPSYLQSYKCSSIFCDQSAPLHLVHQVRFFNFIRYQISFV